jgi:hypothetical protein
MARYRVHQFDINDRVVVTDVIECADDDAAIGALVMASDPDNAVVHTEIWLGPRCVTRATDARAVRRTRPMAWPRL